MPPLLPIKELSSEELAERERTLRKLREELRSEEMKLVLLKKLRQSQQLKENIAAVPKITSKLPPPVTCQPVPSHRWVLITQRSKMKHFSFQCLSLEFILLFLCSVLTELEKHHHHCWEDNLPQVGRAVFMPHHRVCYCLQHLEGTRCPRRVCHRTWWYRNHLIHVLETRLAHPDTMRHLIEPKDQPKILRPHPHIKWRQRWEIKHVTFIILKELWPNHQNSFHSNSVFRKLKSNVYNW